MSGSEERRKEEDEATVRAARTLEKAPRLRPQRRLILRHLQGQETLESSSSRSNHRKEMLVS